MTICFRSGLAATVAMSLSGWLAYSRSVAALRRSMRKALLNWWLHQAVLPVPRGPRRKKCPLGTGRALGMNSMLIANWQLKCHFETHNGNSDAIMQEAICAAHARRSVQIRLLSTPQRGQSTSPQAQELCGESEILVPPSNRS